MTAHRIDGPALFDDFQRVCRNRGLSASGAGMQIGLDPAQMTRLKQGRSQLHASNLLALCKFARLDPFRYLRDNP